MSDVKRWEHSVTWDGAQIAATTMALRENGRYVLASDYDALQQRCRELEDDNKRMAGEELLAIQRGVDERNAIITELRAG